MKPILFVHGIGASKAQYQSIIKFLKEKGFNDFYEFEYEKKYGTVPIKEIAKELSDFIIKHIKEKEIDIIAISQGGIIALAYLKFYKNIEVEKLFTLCSPFYGSKLAHIENLPGLIDLRPKSELLKDLEEFSKESKIDIYSVYTPFDLMVFPGWNARLKHGKRKMVLALTHSLAFFSNSTKKFIFKNLN